MTDSNDKISIKCTLLGCDKNRVDLEKMLANLHNNGFRIVDEDDYADVILIQTCAFISSARQEAIDEIVRAIHLKKIGNVKKVVVAGCLPQLCGDALKEELNEVDLLVRLNDYTNICALIAGLFAQNIKKVDYDNRIRLLTNANHYAYLKISDGCNNCCSYCTIPRIRGRYKSVPIKDLVFEAKQLAKVGAKELILVAQDVTRYGEDLYGENRLIDLLKELEKIKDFLFIRLHYLYPEKLDTNLINYINNSKVVCNYFDIPLQHSSNKILKLMNRRSDESMHEQIIASIRSICSSSTIRSTFIVGYPGETRKDFLHLCNFLKKHQLDNVGFFSYSKEENTPAFYQKNHVANWIKNRRLKTVQKLQRKIADSRCKQRVGQTTRAIVDYFDEKTGMVYCRDEFNSPDIDYVIVAKSSKLMPGSVATIKITGYNNCVFEGEIL